MDKGIKKLNKFIRRYIIALMPYCVFALLTQNAFCYNLSADTINKNIFNKINQETKKQLGNTDYKINIHGSITDVITNDIEAPSIEISQNSNFNPVSYRRVTIKDSKGNIVKTFPVNIQVLIYKDVLVATDNISFGKNIDGTNTKLERKEISKYYTNVITQLPDNSVSAKNIIKNSIIQKNSIKQKSIIEKNQNVDIVFQGRGILITLKGKALNEGAKGDNIMVRSEKYNKTYSAKVDSSSKVTVRI